MYAKTQNLRNGRGQAVASELVCVVLRGVNTLTAIRHNEAMYARLSEDFGGYLVTEDGAVIDLGPVSDWALDCEPVFSDSRWKYENDRPSIYMTGWGPRPSAMQGWAEFAANGYCLDAAWWIAAGSVASRGGVDDGMPSSIVRGDS